MLDSHTDRARRVIVRMAWEAHAGGDPEITNEHRVLAVLAEVKAPPPEAEADPAVGEEPCLAGEYLRLMEIDVDLFEATLRGSRPRPGPPVRPAPRIPMSRELGRALRSQLYNLHGRHGLMHDTALQLVTSVAGSRPAQRAAKQAGWPGVRTRARAVRALKDPRRELDAQARRIFSPAQIDAIADLTKR